MLIRSQDKRYLVNFNSGFLQSNDKYINYCSQSVRDSHVDLGEYRGFDETEQVLDLIQKTYLESPEGIFQMPSREELSKIKK